MKLGLPAAFTTLTAFAVYGTLSQGPLASAPVARKPTDTGLGPLVWKYSTRTDPNLNSGAWFTNLDGDYVFYEVPNDRVLVITQFALSAGSPGTYVGERTVRVVRVSASGEQETLVPASLMLHGHAFGAATPQSHLAHPYYVPVRESGAVLEAGTQLMMTSDGLVDPPQNESIQGELFGFLVDTAAPGSADVLADLARYVAISTCDISPDQNCVANASSSDGQVLYTVPDGSTFVVTYLWPGVWTGSGNLSGFRVFERFESGETQTRVDASATFNPTLPWPTSGALHTGAPNLRYPVTSVGQFDLTGGFPITFDEGSEVRVSGSSRTTMIMFGYLTE